MQPGEGKGQSGDVLLKRYYLQGGPDAGKPYQILYCATCQTLHRHMLETEVPHATVLDTETVGQR